jgi:hypothetical protein
VDEWARAVLPSHRGGLGLARASNERADENRQRWGSAAAFSEWLGHASRSRRIRILPFDDK